MTRIFRYLFKHVAITTCVVVVTLTAAIWLTQSLRFIDWIVNHGLPITTFLYITMLVLPSFLAVILPIALFCSVLFTYQKMQTDSEIVVMRAVGVSSLTLARPALLMAVLVMALSFLINLWLLPVSYRAFKDLQFQIRNNFSNVLIQEGVFTNLDEGLTVFVREQGANGELRGLMVNDGRSAGTSVTLVADSGAMVNTAEGPRIIMLKGNRQEVNLKDGRISFLFFDRYTLDIDRMKNDDVARTRISTERFLPELLDPTDVSDPHTRNNLFAEGHQRLATPLFVPGFVLIGLAALLSGSFSRRGHTIRILIAVAIVVAIQALGIGLGELAAKMPQLIALLYANAMLPILLGGYLLVSGSPRTPLAWLRRPAFET
jgi:lipopolysaccharide export system permease protein